MARVTVEDCLGKVQNRFALVLLVSKRAKQLLKGVSATESARPDNKYIVNSLREVADGRVNFDMGVDSSLSPERQIESDLNR